MERLLLLWDELDDWSHACRHVAMSAMTEVAAVTAPITVTIAAFAAASFWGMFRHFVTWAG